jgi:hypothetical protein
VDEITPGPELAILVLVEVPAYFLSESWLVTYELIDSVGEEASVSIATKAFFGPAFAKFNFPLDRRVLTYLIVDYCHAH